MSDFHCSSCGFDFEDSAPTGAVDWKPRCPRCLRVSAVEILEREEPTKLRKKPRFLRIWLVFVCVTLVVGMVVGVALTDTSDQAQRVGEATGAVISVATLVSVAAWISWHINRIGHRKPRKRRPPTS